MAVLNYRKFSRVGHEHPKKSKTIFDHRKIPRVIMWKVYNHKFLVQQQKFAKVRILVWLQKFYHTASFLKNYRLSLQMWEIFCGQNRKSQPWGVIFRFHWLKVSMVNFKLWILDGKFDVSFMYKIRVNCVKKGLLGISLFIWESVNCICSLFRRLDFSRIFGRMDTTKWAFLPTWHLR